MQLTKLERLRRRTLHYKYFDWVRWKLLVSNEVAQWKIRSINRPSAEDTYGTKWTLWPLLVTMSVRVHILSAIPFAL